jgi:hypothetical protein
MIESTEQAIEHGIGVIARQKMTFKAPIIGRFSHKSNLICIQLRSLPTDIATSSQKQLQCPHTVTVYSGPVIG